MKKCPYCGNSNYDNATVCRKCDGSFFVQPGTIYETRSYWLGPEKAKNIRRRALSLIVLGLMVKVYWGGYGAWPVIDFPILMSLRTWLEPLLLFGGAVLYCFGWIAAFV